MTDFALNLINGDCHIPVSKPSIGKWNLLGLIFFSFFKIYLFVYLWMHWVSVALCRLSLVVESGGYSLVGGTQAPQCSRILVFWARNPIRVLCIGRWVLNHTGPPGKSHQLLMFDLRIQMDTIYTPHS